ncbi:MAG: metallophosphoesterase [Chitinophagaceae bacterium]|nr:metallophosphoesterase [Chitinophagaceae bacterium]
MRSTSTWIIVAAIMLLLDFYVFQALKTVSQNSSDRTKNVLFYSYWTISIATIISVLFFPKLHLLQTSKFFRNYVFAILVGLLFAKVIAATLFLFDDIRRALLWTMQKLFSVTGAQYMPEENGISRSVFLSWLGLGLGSSLFGSLLYGFSNKYNYQIKKHQLTFSNLPKAFKGFKIIHISDIHCGSFNDQKAVQLGIDLILQQNADLILFTGDLVNDRHDEVFDYIDIFKQLKAPFGVFSTLGNHDYGDYVQWPSKQAKAENLNKLMEIQQQMGWKLLMNEHVVLEKEEDKIALIGIENWSNKARFPKYGKLNEAYKGTEIIPFKILMSHDPSHWDAEVRPNYPDIDLTLSGHTHGMQFGVELPFFKFSPVQWVYKQWAGLYEDGQQKINVNRGFGFIGYPGRVGILPEITVIEFV